MAEVAAAALNAVTVSVSRAPAVRLHTLPNGVRLLALVQPHLRSASVSVFVRTGSRHESTRLNGISHVVEHMAFKGTATRDCQRINLDAERLGADVNAHTDKDHTAYHMRGRAGDAPAFIRMLGDIALNGSFPADELEREREVILQEFLEDEDDALSTAFKLFDAQCFGRHPLAQPVIGLRRNIERFTRDELLDYVRRQYTGRNLIVAVAGPLDAEALLPAVEAAFGALPAGDENRIAAPTWVGGLKLRRVPGCSQTHVVLGYPLAPLGDASMPAAVMAATVFGEGMSSPLLDRVRERLGLVYHAGCSADIGDLAGQFVIDASTTPEHLDAFLAEVTTLLHAHADAIDPVHLERARNQLAVRSLRLAERPQRHLETAALDLFALGRVRGADEWLAQVDAVDAEAVRAQFRQMLAAPVAAAITGKVPAGSRERARERLATTDAAPGDPALA